MNKIFLLFCVSPKQQVCVLFKSSCGVSKKSMSDSSDEHDGIHVRGYEDFNRILASDDTTLIESLFSQLESLKFDIHKSCLNVFSKTYCDAIQMIGTKVDP